MFLPDGEHFLFLVLSQKPEYSGIYFGSLNSKDTTRLVSGSNHARFVPPDKLLFMRENSLMLLKFNPNGIKLEGDPARSCRRCRSRSRYGQPLRVRRVRKRSTRIQAWRSNEQPLTRVDRQRR
jgi:hypothetical protein